MHKIRLFIFLLVLVFPVLSISDNWCFNNDYVVSQLGVASDLKRYFGLEVHSCNNLRLNGDGVGFFLDSNDVFVNGGVRSEAVIDYPFSEGDVVEYRWEALFPSGNSIGTYDEGWWVIAQWHDQPDPSKNEKWLTFPSKPPPFSVFVQQQNRIIKVGLQSFDGSKLNGTSVDFDKWIKFSAVVKWSTKSDGYVIFFVNDLLVDTMLGVNMHNSYQHYFKFGQYRSPRLSIDSLVYIKNIFVRNVL